MSNANEKVRLLTLAVRNLAHVMRNLTIISDAMPGYVKERYKAHFETIHKLLAQVEEALRRLEE